VTGRTVYGGGGIAPDESITARTITAAQRRLLSPLFGFTRELVNGRIAGLTSYKVPGSIDFYHELQPNDFAVDEVVVKAFREFMAKEPTFKPLMPLIDHNQRFIQLQLRFSLVTAAYGRVMADRVFITTDDPQVAKAVDVLPRARNLAMSATRHHVQP